MLRTNLYFDFGRSAPVYPNFGLSAPVYMYPNRLGTPRQPTPALGAPRQSTQTLGAPSALERTVYQAVNTAAKEVSITNSLLFFFMEVASGVWLHIGKKVDGHQYQKRSPWLIVVTTPLSNPYPSIPSCNQLIDRCPHILLKCHPTRTRTWVLSMQGESNYH